MVSPSMTPTTGPLKSDRARDGTHKRNERNRNALGKVFTIGSRVESAHRPIEHTLRNLEGEQCDVRATNHPIVFCDSSVAWPIKLTLLLLMKSSTLVPFRLSRIPI